MSDMRFNRGSSWIAFRQVGSRMRGLLSMHWIRLSIDRMLHVAVTPRVIKSALPTYTRTATLLPSRFRGE